MCVHVCVCVYVRARAIHNRQEQQQLQLQRRLQYDAARAYRRRIHNGRTRCRFINILHLRRRRGEWRRSVSQKKTLWVREFPLRG